MKHYKPEELHLRCLGDPDAYYKLVEQRGADGCTPEQQAGPDATECSRCHRMTQHQHCQVCMVPGCVDATPVSPAK